MKKLLLVLFLAGTVACFVNSSNAEGKAGKSNQDTIIGGKFTDFRDGRVYKTVTIGTQTWMAENLAYKTISGCWAYNNDMNYVPAYGYLYDWENAKSACPAGWHLPSDAEWQILIDYFLGKNSAGGSLKEIGITHWISPNLDATNYSWFTARPGGCRESGGSFNGIHYNGNWWSSSELQATYVWCRRLYYNSSEVLSFNSDKSWGYSVRCVKDN